MDETVIGAVFSENRTSVLLIKRRDVPVWVLPGGGIEAGELPESACIREVLEESGFNVKVIRKVGEYTPINRLSRFTHLYECSVIDGKATITSESQAVKFFPLDQLPKLIPPPHDEWILDAKQQANELIRKKLSRVNYKTLFKQLFFHPILVLRFFLTKIGLTINT